jgi:ribonuclease J
MDIDIQTVGGYNEVGKNMTAIKVNGETVVMDMGIHLDNYIKYAEDEDINTITRDELMTVGAVPDVSRIEKWQDTVRAIVPTHAHLDHVGAIPHLASLYKAPVLGTPFTNAVIGSMLKDNKIKIPNKLQTLNSNSIYSISKDLKVEFINVTHSTPQTVMAALHTPKGVVLYANDFKFDRYPVLGKKPNFKRLGELGRKGVHALICDSTYAREAKKMPSESVAKEMLRDVMLGTDSKGKAMIMTTFSSHLARLKSIIEFGKKMNRKVLFLGRSLNKYVTAGEDVGIIKFRPEVEISKYSKQVKRRLKKITKRNRHKYLLVVTGHQGEPRATLTKMVEEKFDFRFEPDDHVVFSCTVIPTATNRQNRDYLERSLKEKGVRIFRDIHVSGHAAREDLRDMIHLVKPKHIVPAHGNMQMTAAMSDLATEMGYAPENIHLMRNGQRLRL